MDLYSKVQKRWKFLEELLECLPVAGTTEVDFGFNRNHLRTVVATRVSINRYKLCSKFVVHFSAEFHQ